MKIMAFLLLPVPKTMHEMNSKSKCTF
jgi:hypothetical protein